MEIMLELLNNVIVEKVYCQKSKFKTFEERFDILLGEVD